MKFRKSISVILLAAILCSTAACADSGEKPEDTTGSSTSAGDTETATGTETGRESVSDELPEKNYSGAVFTILDRVDQDYEFAAEEENADLMNDAIYRRNAAVEDRFGVSIETMPLACAWGEQATAFNNILRSSVMAGDGAYDLVAGYAATIPGLVSEGLFVNWRDLSYIDLSKPWWSGLLADDLTINGKDYMISGDISLTLWEYMTCMFFNKRLADSYGTGDIYELVNSGEWTFDKLIELTKSVYQDVDGDGKRSVGDSYGLLMGWATDIDALKEAFEIHVTEKDSDGFPKVALINEHTVEAVTKINDYIYNNNGVYGVFANSDSDLENMFRNGQGLFYTAYLGRSEKLRDMSDDFGIIPYPKYDEKQENYHSTSLDGFSLFVLPMDAKDKEMSSIITEALCAESYKKVVPVFYDTVLKIKMARDDVSSHMIDLIRDNLTFDFGYLHSNSIGGVGHLFVGWIRDNNNNIVSSYEKKQSTIEKQLNDVLEVYR